MRLEFLISMEEKYDKQSEKRSVNLQTDSESASDCQRCKRIPREDGACVSMALRPGRCAQPDPEMKIRHVSSRDGLHLPGEPH